MVVLLASATDSEKEDSRNAAGRMLLEHIMRDGVNQRTLKSLFNSCMHVKPKQAKS